MTVDTEDGKMRTPKIIMKKGRRNGQFTRKTASKSGKEREPHKTEKETKQNCKGISTLRWTTWSLKKVEFLQVAQKENVTGLSVNSNIRSEHLFMVLELSDTISFIMKSTARQ